MNHSASSIKQLEDQQGSTYDQYVQARPPEVRRQAAKQLSFAGGHFKGRNRLSPGLAAHPEMWVISNKQWSHSGKLTWKLKSPLFTGVKPL